MPLVRKDDIEYEEKKAKRFRVGELSFYVIDDVIEAKIEAGASITQGGAKGSKETTRITHAIVVEDPRYRAMPLHVWEEVVKKTVMDTLSTYGNMPPADIPHADSIVVTASGSMIGGITCRNCGKTIPFNESRCPYCGTLSPATG